LDDYRQPMVQMAYDIWGMDEVIQIECENGNRDPFAKWDNGNAKWLCQMNVLYNKIPAEYYNDWWFQIRYCNEKRLWGTPFYWPSRKNKKTGIACYQEVQSRFTITPAKW